MERYLKSGEFARFFGTTKETLRHYRNIGLLEPALIAENGYALYTVAQFTDFLLISSLQHAGCSLKHIENYLSTPSNTELKSVIEERIEALEKEQAALALSQRLLKNTLSRINILDSWPDRTKYRLEICPEEYLIETQVLSPADWEDDLLRQTMAHLEFCREHNLFEEIQQGFRVRKQSFLSRDYDSGFFISSKVSEKVDSNRLHIKPQGTYLKWLRRIDLLSDEIPESVRELVFNEYDTLNDYLAQQGYLVTGDLYEKEVSVYAGDISETFYSEIALQVEIPDASDEMTGSR